ncbi:hypothetical protein BCEP4_1080036 [Burkholderia cepacia]|nr:hypothetical protein BCEP4_1080036 [Burkholderia cepacia]
MARQVESNSTAALPTVPGGIAWDDLRCDDSSRDAVQDGGDLPKWPLQVARRPVDGAAFNPRQSESFR